MSNKLLHLTLGASLLVLGLGAAGSLSAANYCSDAGGNLDGLTTGDMTFEYAATLDCYGVVTGNPSVNDPLPDVKWGSFSFLVKDDGNGSTGTVDGVEFTLTGDVDKQQGDWTLSWKTVGTPGLPITLQLVGVLKSQTAYAAYLFDEYEFTVDPATGEGSFKIAFCVEGACNNFPNLSNLSLWYEVVPGDGDPGDGDTGIPEPASLALFGGGLLALGWAIRRRNRMDRLS